jgi:16S rRNA (uracil1498-N3)-methyltransferase
MPRRFFSAVDFSSDSLELTGREAHHLQRVLRMQPGESVWLFDGQGHEVLAQIVSVQRDAVLLHVTERRDLAHSTVPPVTIATGVPKGDRFRWLIEKATELGVQRIVPLVTQRSIVDPGQGKLDKLRQTIVESCKQCGRSQLMELTEPISWRDCLTSELPGCEAWIAHPHGDPVTSQLMAPGLPKLFLIGPEGGFTDDEVDEAITAGARRMQLGPRILRIETAVVAIASLVCLQSQ